MKWLLVNVDGREYETDHCTNAYIYRRSYWATISQNFTYVPKVLNFFLLYIWGCPRWASYQLTKDLNEKNNCLRNKYWLNGFSHKRRIVIKARPHESNDSKLWFMEFMTTPTSSPQLSLLILSSRVLLVARVFRCVDMKFWTLLFIATNSIFSAVVERNVINSFHYGAFVSRSLTLATPPS